jgi:hypothetical protein
MSLAIAWIARTIPIVRPPCEQLTQAGTSRFLEGLGIYPWVHARKRSAGEACYISKETTPCGGDPQEPLID